jgi:TetR/AcrR family transcriptional repressor of bet genes
MAAETESRRRRILDATLDEIRDKGLAGTRAHEIAKRAGVSSGLVLYHFESLDGVIAAAMEESDDRYYRSLADEDDAERSAPERLRLLVSRAVDPASVVDGWTLWMEFWVRALRDPATADLCARLERRWRSALLAIIEQGIAEGVFEPPDPAASMIRLSALLDGLSVATTLEDPEVPGERIVDIWLEGAARELGCDPSLLSG